MGTAGSKRGSSIPIKFIVSIKIIQAWKNTQSLSGSAPHKVRLGFCGSDTEDTGLSPLSNPTAQAPSELVVWSREWLGHPPAMGGVLGKSQQVEIW